MRGDADQSAKIKIKKPEKGMQAVEDLTAKDVEIVIHLAPGVSPDITIDALYAFTECEVSISPNACVIFDEKPHFVTVSHILKTCNDQTVHLLKRELEIKRFELKEKLLYSSLEKIFIENRIYRDIEECETWEAVLSTIDTGLRKYVVTPDMKPTAADTEKLMPVSARVNTPPASPSGTARNTAVARPNVPSAM